MNDAQLSRARDTLAKFADRYKRLIEQVLAA
jgi:hypothetical protein